MKESPLLPRPIFAPHIFTLPYTGHRLHPDEVVKRVQDLGNQGPIVIIGIPMMTPEGTREVMHTESGRRIGVHMPATSTVPDVFVIDVPKTAKLLQGDRKLLQALTERRVLKRARTFLTAIDEQYNLKPSAFHNATFVFSSLGSENMLAACFVSGSLPEQAMKRFTNPIVRIVGDTMHAWRVRRSPERGYHALDWYVRMRHASRSHHDHLHPALVDSTRHRAHPTQ